MCHLRGREVRYGRKCLPLTLRVGAMGYHEQCASSQPALSHSSNSTTRRGQEKPTPHTYALVSLGCPKNLVDSERMAGLLQLDGYRMVAEPDGADLVVVNTCGFIADARAESYDAIEEMLRLKQRGRVGRVIVAGCLAERDKEQLLEQYPGNRSIGRRFRPGRNRHRALATARSGRGRAAGGCFGPPRAVPCPIRGRRRITLRHLAYLKIAEGCNRLCSFCSIPQMRGPYASKPIEQVVAEAEELAADGVRELVLVAQDTTFYGLDIDGRAAAGRTACGGWTRSRGWPGSA